MAKAGGIMKKCFHFLWILAVLFPVCISGHLKVKAAEAAYEKRAKRIISVVYDDSVSMVNSNDSWAQANYAMQVLASLLDEEDQMYITYMSRCYGEGDATEEVDLKNIDEAVKKIRDTESEFSGTPLEAVVYAKQKLESVKETDEDAQYWLLILTDGSMSSTDEYLGLQEALDDYKGDIMANQSPVHIMYMGIGDAAADIKGDESQQFYAKKCGKDIVPALRDIANQISGRIQFKKDAIKKIDSKTVRVHSNLPLYSISVLTQKSKASVNTAKGEEMLTVDRNIQLKYPPLSSGENFASKETKKNLYGNASIISNGSSLILPGDYTIIFSDDIDLDNTVFMYQPAVLMDVRINRQGTVIKKEDIIEGDLVDLEIIVINPATGQEIPEKDLPEPIQWKISYEVDGKVIDSADGKKLKGINILKGENKFICSMKVGDFIPQVQTISFNPGMILGIETEASDSARFKRGHMGAGTCSGKPYLFYVTGNGKRLSKKELPKKARILIKSYELVPGSATGNWFLTGGLYDAKPGLMLHEDGSFELYPKNAGLFCFLVRSGEYKVTVELKEGSGIESEGVYIVTGAYKDWLLAIILLLLFGCFGYIVYILFIKAKFNNQVLYINYYTSDGRSGGIRNIQMCKKLELHKFHDLSVLLPGPSTTTVYGITFIADSYGGIYIKGKNVKKVMEKYGFPVGLPEKRFVRMIQAMKSTKDKKDPPEMIPVSTKKLYLYKYGVLYQIYVK